MIFTPGTIVKGALSTGSSIFIVRDAGKTVNLVHFEAGFGYLIERKDAVNFTQVGVPEFIDHYSQVAKDLEQRAQHGGLTGAILLRRKHNLDGVLAGIEQTNPLYVAKNMPESPKTGVYVLEGVYGGHGPSKHVQGIKVEPRITEEVLSRLMMQLHPKGFGKIPFEVRNTEATSHGDLVGYNAYEVPEQATSWVYQPKKLELKFS